MNTLELNRIAIWKPKLIDELSIRPSGAGRLYADNKVIKKTTATTYRYAKNYEKKNTKFCLMVVSYSDKAKYIEQQLDKIAKKLKTIQPDSNFEYLDYYLEEK